MTIWTLALRSLRHYAKAHLGAFLGAAVGSAVLVGALVVGDSVRGTLRSVALNRIGRVELAIASNDRFFTDQLATNLGASLQSTLAAVVQLNGTAARQDNAARANHIQLLGVDAAFWQLAPSLSDHPKLEADEVLLNRPLAEQLRAKVGETILVRAPKPSQISRDAPLSTEEDSSIALRLKVTGIVEEGHFGRFSLQANQTAALNAFVSRAFLQSRAQVTNRSNLILIAGDGSGAASNQVAKVRSTIRQLWKAADAELELRALPGASGVEVRTSRVFIDPTVELALGQLRPKGEGVLTYFVNELRHGTNSTPYSMVASVTSPLIAAELKPNEMIVNSWLADDLALWVGDRVEMKYFVIGALRTLETRTNAFTVKQIVPLKGVYADRSLMPDFPGMVNAANCRDWDAGFPIKFDAIRPKDQKYWEEYRGTPKAFIGLAEGQSIWTNRFGNLTAMRFAFGTPADLEKAIMAKLDPAALGLSVVPIREQALAASGQSQDFGGLFIGFSFFLIISAVLLTAMMFAFAVQQRATEIGTLLAIGFRPRQVRLLLLAEGALIATLGSVLGLFGGVYYAKGMLWGLTTVWHDAVGLTRLDYHAEPATLIGGCVGSIFVATIAIWLALRNEAARPARELLSEGSAEFSRPTEVKPAGLVRCGLRKAFSGTGLGMLCGIFALASVGYALATHQTANAELFYTAGFFLLISGLGWFSAWLKHLGAEHAAELPTLTALGIRNASRRHKRTLATISLLASGSFLVASIGVFRLEGVEGATKRSSGTGGFALIGESSLPVVHDLNGEAGRDFYGINAKELADVKVVPLRVRDGDEASCLNLNRAQNPRLLGVRPELLAERESFTFAEVMPGVDKTKPWLALKRPAGDDAVPTIGDEASILWAMGRKVGDTMDYTDERGRTFKLRIVGAVANSILQGNLVIDETEFTARFPTEAGYRYFLLDAPVAKVEAVSASLARALRDTGLELTPTVKRLAAFNAVQNTYLGTFEVLGGLGLVLGSFGLGVVVLRNLLERRGELALMLALGFRRGALNRLVTAEHLLLLLAGLGLGVVAALLAVLPALWSRGASSFGSTAVLLAVVFVSGLLWTKLALRAALKGRILASLRNE